MVVSKKDDTMESMSHTRKEIANRLGVSVRSGAKTTMGLKLVKTFPAGSNNLSAKIYRDSDYNGYLVRFFESGKHNENADYDTEDLQDAIGTAQYSISHYKLARPGTKAKFADWLTPHQYKAIEQENKSVSDEILRLKSDINRLTQKMLGLTSGSEKELLVGKIQTKTQTMKDFQSSLAKANARLARLNAPIFTRPGSKANMAAASGAPDTSMFADRIRKYEARESKDELMDPKVIKQDVRALNAVLMYVKAGDRKRAVRWVDSLDTVLTDVIPRSIYNWIYKGYSARPGEKAKFGLRYVKVLKSKPCLPREARIFQDTEDNSYFVKYFENDNVVKEDEADSLANAINSAQAFIKAGTRPAFSRSGAKAKFEATGSKKYFLGELDTIIAGISEMNRLLEKQARGNPKIKEVSTALNKAESALEAAESKLMQIDFSRSGAKVKFNWKESTTKINDDLNVALQAINANDLDKAIRYIKQAQTRAFYIFSRPGAKVVK